MSQALGVQDCTSKTHYCPLYIAIPNLGEKKPQRLPGTEAIFYVFAGNSIQPLWLVITCKRSAFFTG